MTFATKLVASRGELEADPLPLAEIAEHSAEASTMIDVVDRDG